MKGKESRPCFANLSIKATQVLLLAGVLMNIYEDIGVDNDVAI